MKKFYGIFSNDHDNPTTKSLLEQACKTRDLTFVVIKAESFDFTNPPSLKNGDILYRVSTSQRSRVIFKSLLNEGIATIYNDQDSVITGGGDDVTRVMLDSKYNLSIIKTIFDLPSERQLLQRYVEYLGGFPIILKATGGSHGVGVMKLDSFESLASVADYLLKHQGPGIFYMLRQYVDYVMQARLIVLSGKVIDSIQYHRVPDDFRSNVGKELRVEAKKFDSTIERLAIRSVEVSRADFGGVDVLIDKQGKGYLAETNIPCFFPRSEMTTGTDIAGMLVNHLILKGKAM